MGNTPPTPEQRMRDERAVLRQLTHQFDTQVEDELEEATSDFNAALNAEREGAYDQAQQYALSHDDHLRVARGLRAMKRKVASMSALATNAAALVTLNRSVLRIGWTMRGVNQRIKPEEFDKVVEQLTKDVQQQLGKMGSAADGAALIGQSVDTLADEDVALAHRKGGAYAAIQQRIKEEEEDRDLASLPSVRRLGAADADLADEDSDVHVIG